MGFKLHVHGQAHGVAEAILGRITTRSLVAEQRPDHVLLCQEPLTDIAGYAAVLLPRGREFTLAESAVPMVGELPYCDHLSEGDVVAVQPSGYVRTLYKEGSPHNAIFATDRCNSFCLMCSQPPKPNDDRDRIRDHLRLVELLAMSPPSSLGITGGEPPLLGRDFIRLIAACAERLPETYLHVLTNGRLFYYDSFCRALAAVESIGAGHSCVLGPRL